MFRLWGILRKNNKRIKDMVADCNLPGLSEAEQFHRCLQEICYTFDIQRPMWLPKDQRDYDAYKRVVLKQDNFIESIDFDALELELLEDED